MKRTLLRHPVDVRFLWIGLLFFINPNVAVVDFLPDCVGAVLILIGFLHLAEIDERAQRARKYYTILAFVSAGRALSLLLTAGAAGTVWPLIFTFAFGIAEGFLFVYATFCLIDAIDYRAMRADADPVYSGFSARKPLTVVIAVLKHLLCFLPELTLLQTDYGEVTTAPELQTTGFIHTALTILNVAVTLLYGAGYWIYLFRWLKTVGAQHDFLKRTEAVYIAEVVEKPGALTYRALTGAGTLFFAGILFLLPLRLDGIDFLPDFLAGALLLLAVLRLGGAVSAGRKAALLSGTAYSLLSLGEWVFALLFRRSLNTDASLGYYGSAQTILLHYPQKLTTYFLLTALSICKYLALAVFLFCICRLFTPVIREHTGSPFELSAESGMRRSQQIKERLQRRRIVLIVLSMLTAGAGIAYSVLRMFTDFLPLIYSELAFSLALFAYYIFFLSALREGVDNKYFLVKN